MKSKITLKLVISLLIAIFAFSFFTPVLAQDNTSEEGGTYNFQEQSGLNATADAAGYTEENQKTTLEQRVSRVINAVLIMLGILFLGLVIFAGITWMTAFGNDEKVAKATELLKEAIVGLVVVIAAYAISWFIFYYFVEGKVWPPLG